MHAQRPTRTMEALAPASDYPEPEFPGTAADAAAVLAAVAAILDIPVRDGYALYYPSK